MENPISKYSNLDVNNQWNLRDNEVTNNPKKKGPLDRIIDRIRSNSMSLGKIIDRIGTDIQKASVDNASSAKDLVALREKVSAKSQNWQEKTSFIGRHLGGHGNVKRSADELSNLVDAKLLSMFTGKARDPQRLTPTDKMMAQHFYEGFTKADMTGMEAIQFIRLVEGSGAIGRNAESADDFWDKFANLGFANAAGLKELHAAMQGRSEIMDNPLISHFASQPNGIRNITNVLKLPDADKEWKIENRNLLIETGSVIPEEGIELRLEGYKQREATFKAALRDNPGLKRERFADTEQVAFTHWRRDLAEKNPAMTAPDMELILPGIYLGNNNYTSSDPDFLPLLEQVNTKIDLIYRFEDKEHDGKLEITPKVDKTLTFSEKESLLNVEQTDMLVNLFDEICERERSRDDGSVLFQCAKGVNRSAASLVAVIADKYNLTVDEALKVVYDGRPFASVSTDLTPALYLWEAKRNGASAEYMQNKARDLRIKYVLDETIPSLAEYLFDDNPKKTPPKQRMFQAIISGEGGYSKDPGLVASVIEEIKKMDKAEQYLKALHLNSIDDANAIISDLKSGLNLGDYDKWLNAISLA